MEFFNTKHVAIKAISNSEDLEIGVSVSIPFYISEVYQDTALTSVEYQVILQSGRTQTVLTELAAVFEGTGTNTYSFTYNPVGTTGNEIRFRFKIIDIDADEHFVDSSMFKLISSAI